MNRKVLLLLLALILVLAPGCKKAVDADTDATDSTSESQSDFSREEASDEGMHNGEGTAAEGDEDDTSPDGSETPQTGVRPNDGYDPTDPWTSEPTEPATTTEEPTTSVSENDAKEEDEKPANSDIAEDADDFKDCTYEEYHNMSASAQQEFFAKFGSYEAFFEWYNDAKDKYKLEHPENIVDGGEIDLNEVVGN